MAESAGISRRALDTVLLIVGVFDMPGGIFLRISGECGERVSGVRIHSFFPREKHRFFDDACKGLKSQLVEFQSRVSSFV